MRCLIFSLALTCGLASDLEAQMCAGGVSFNFAPVQIGLASSWSQTSRGAAVSLGYGADRLFGAASAATFVMRQADVHAFAGRLAIGANQAVRLDNRLHVCPTVSLGYTRAGTRARVKAGARVGAGWVARNGPTLAVIAAAGIGFRDYATSDGIAGEGNDPVGALDFGAGLVFRLRYALAPRVIVPIGGADARPTIAIGFTYSFAR